MKTVVNFEFPIEPFNTLVRNGTAGQLLEEVLEEIKPEAVYFYAPHGCRGGTMVVDLADPSQIPSIAEPLFLKFDAKCQFYPAMTPEALADAGLAELGKRWG
ncbi:panthothenate synthetase [Marinobacterium arenosum]|uniref:panthothenate synthetase n=1 Tax=Marinobacterium arenosum TaxID=2862496 RepID=UPI001C96F986|nr:panthothenate synthetase [Marinobacterium arenosum]MBY4677629.1 panthothenate synthetase [Marinobacterium arenosum]